MSDILLRQMKFHKLTKSQYSFIDAIDGWLTEPSSNLLYSLAKNCKGKGIIVEIGSWKGRSTTALGFGSKAGKKVKILAIDHHTGSPFERQLFDKPIWTFEEFKRNIKKAKIDDMVIPKVATSEEVAKNWKKPVELLWIDGSHVYEDVKKDFELWFPHVIEGGYVVMDDTINIFGPRKVAIDNIYNSRMFTDVGIIDALTYGKKIKRNSIKDILRNKYILCINYFSYFVWRIPTPKFMRLAGKKILQFLQ